jgi:signal peptidase I
MQRASKSKPIWHTIKEWAVLLLAVFIIRTVIFSNYQVPSGSMETTMLVGERLLADKLTPFFWPAERSEIIAFNDATYEYSDNRLVNWFQRYVWGPANWTKRVIGIPGDHVQGMIEANGEGDPTPVVYVNGSKLDEPYLNKYPLIPVVIDDKLVMQSWDPSKPYDQQPFYAMDECMVQQTQHHIEHLNRPPVLYPGVPAEDGFDEFDVHLGENEYWVMGDNRLGSGDSRHWGVLPGHLIHGRVKWRYFSVDSYDSWLVLDLVLHPISFWSKVRWSRCMQWVR